MKIHNPNKPYIGRFSEKFSTNIGNIHDRRFAFKRSQKEINKCLELLGLPITD